MIRTRVAPLRQRKEFTLNRQHHRNSQHERGNGHRHRHAPETEQRRHSMPLTAEGFPAATAEMPKTSPTVFVSEESRRRYPWLPARVIAGSIWRGPQQEHVRVDETGKV